jgi:hypothetical protein
VRESVFYETEYGRTGAEFLALVERRLQQGRFDVLRIDPLQAFCGGDIREPDLIASFLRSGLGPILQRQGVACVVNHHTPKTTHRDTSLWRGSDWMYAGAGGADLTNWARAILVIDPTYSPHVFKFIAAKRGARIGWCDDAGEREDERYFCHASDGLYWRPATPGDIAEAAEAAENARNGGSCAGRTAEDLTRFMPKTGAMPKNELIELAGAADIGEKKARQFIRQLLAAGTIFEHYIKRPHTNPEVRLSFHPQELLEKVG